MKENTDAHAEMSVPRLGARPRAPRAPGLGHRTSYFTYTMVQCVSVTQTELGRQLCPSIPI